MTWELLTLIATWLWLFCVGRASVAMAERVAGALAEALAALFLVGLAVLTVVGAIVVVGLVWLIRVRARLPLRAGLASGTGDHASAS